MAWGKERPVKNNISNAWSKSAESLPPGAITGRIVSMSSNNGESNIDSLASIQFLFPRTVLISPL